MKLRSESTETKVNCLTFGICFAVTAGLLTCIGFQEYFKNPIEETGDFAANSLQIAKALECREITGNYSRWGFNHPGPAFFYVYAAGQWLFHDIACICPQEHNAQLLTGMLLQSFFWSLSLTIVGWYLKSPTGILFVGCIAIVHFLATEQAFISIWPPHQILMPFACMMLSAASMVTGERNWLWVFVLSSCFLVHGHVAQPLFVLPMAIVSLLGLMFRAPSTQTDGGLGFGRRCRTLFLQKDMAVAGVLITIFLLPLILDLCKGTQSNVAKILRHALYNAASDHSVIDSLVYLLQFYRYWETDAVLKNVDMQATPLLHTFAFACWLSIAILSLIAAYRGLSRWDAQTSHWFSGLLLVVLVANALTILWGHLMDGEMHAFNGYFNYAIIYVELCLCLSVVWKCLVSSKLRFVLVATAMILMTNAAIGYPTGWISDAGWSGLRYWGPIHKVAGAKDSYSVYLRNDEHYDAWPILAANVNYLRKNHVSVGTNDAWGVLVGRDYLIDRVLLGQPVQKIVPCDLVKLFNHQAQGISATHKDEYELAISSKYKCDSAEKTFALDDLRAYHSGFSDRIESESSGPFLRTRGEHSVVFLQPQTEPIGLNLEIDLAPSGKGSRVEIRIGQTLIDDIALEGRTRIVRKLDNEVIAQCMNGFGALIILISPCPADESFLTQYLFRSDGLKIFHLALVRQG